MRSAVESFRAHVLTDRVLDSGMAALVVAFLVAFALDLAIDSTWLPELFFGIFAAGFAILYRSRKAPPLRTGEMVSGLGWMLLLFTLTLAVLRVYVRISDALG